MVSRFKALSIFFCTFSLLKELNNLVYQYTTDYTFQHFDEMIAKLQDKIEWGFIYPHVKRREDKIAIIHYGDYETTRISIHKTFDYNEIYEDDVFFEQLLTSFRKYYLWLKETPDEETITINELDGNKKDIDWYGSTDPLKIGVNFGLQPLNASNLKAQFKSPILFGLSVIAP